MSNIENIKKAFTSVIGISKDIVPLFDDGKISRTELFSLLFIAPKIPAVVENAKASLSEFKRLKPADAELVVVHIKEVLDLENDDLEAKIEKAIDLIAEGYSLVIALIAFGKDVSDFSKSLKVA